jgi:hypothetical protein
MQIKNVKLLQLPPMGAVDTFTAFCQGKLT